MKILIPSAWKTKEGIKIPAEEQKEFITTIHEDEGHSGWERTRLRLKRERIQEVSQLHKVFKQVKQQCLQCAQKEHPRHKVAELPIRCSERGKHFSADCAELSVKGRNGHDKFLAIADNGGGSVSIYPLKRQARLLLWP